MSSLILAGLLAITLVAFTVKVGLGLSWLWTGVISATATALLAALVLYFRGTAATLAAFRAHLVDDVNTLWKRWSVWIQITMASLGGTWWVALPDDWKAAVPKGVLIGVLVISAIATIGAQSVKQKSLTPKDGDQ